MQYLPLLFSVENSILHSELLLPSTLLVQIAQILSIRYCCHLINQLIQLSDRMA